MATVTGFTAEHMQEIVDGIVVGGHITGDDLILVTTDATEINAGDVRGPMGPAGGPPIGTVLTTILAVAPVDYVLCFGQTIVGANVTYPTLWAVVDPTWKSGNNLIVPDLRGRVDIGKDNMGGLSANRITAAIAGFDGDVMGAVGGNERMQQHNHPITDPGHPHNTGQGIVIGAGLVDFAPGDQSISTIAGNNTTGITVNNNGSGTSQNVQPSIVFNRILRLQ